VQHEAEYGDEAYQGDTEAVVDKEKKPVISMVYYARIAVLDSGPRSRGKCGSRSDCLLFFQVPASGQSLLL
jgi:hypothetical protein